MTSAEYHGDTKTSSIAIVDEDSDKTIFVMKKVPMRVEQKYLLKTDYDLTGYEQWEGVDENNEEDKRDVDETWHEY